jgi:uncharacterized protein involved in exopolysaccharide biosynthesis
MEDANFQKSADYEEIDIRDIFLFFVRNLFFILKIGLLAAGLAFIAGYLTPKVYQVKTVLEIGSLLGSDKSAVIEEPVQIKEKLDEGVYAYAVREKLNISQSDFPKIKSVSIAGINVISFSLESSRPETGKQILSAVNNIILNEHNKAFDLGVKNLQAEIEIDKKSVERIKRQLDLLESQKKVFNDKITTLQNISILNQDIGVQFALLNAKERLEGLNQQTEDYLLRINTEEKNINSLQAKIDQGKATAVIKEPNVSENPVKPRILLNTLLAAVLGSGVGLLWAFGREAMKKA